MSQNRKPKKKQDNEEHNNKYNNELFKDLMKKQLPTVPYKKRLQYSDIKRICKYINETIFHPHKCSLWGGYVTNSNNTGKGTYINFYFRKKKVALHRLLYENFVGELSKTEYLKFTCENKGKCCNVNHLKKFSYNKKRKSRAKKKVSSNKKSIDTTKSVIIDKTKKLTKEEIKKRLHVDFD